MKKNLSEKIQDLFGEDVIVGKVEPITAPRAQEVVRLIAIDRLTPDPAQPRKFFDMEKIAELGQSILENGLIQPIIARPQLQGDRFEIIAGERRYRAALASGIKEIPVIVRSWDDHRSALAALVENIQRQDLKPLERAEAFAELIEHHRWKQQDLAQKIGLSRAQVTNTLRLLKLHPLCLEYLNEDKISEGHAKILCSLPKAQQEFYAQAVVKKNWSVRKLEEALKKDAHQQQSEENFVQHYEKNPYFEYLEEKIQEQVQTKIEIRPSGSADGSGRLVFFYESDDGLGALLERLGLLLEEDY